MKIQPITPAKSLNIAYRKSSLRRDEVETFISATDPRADTTVLEAEIDRLVYELYGLTEEEIKIVEGG
jgi:adenine-specific DNA-methyltransferase